jgi:RNA polymerase sigma-70 factor (ECF subfamily)
MNNEEKHNLSDEELMGLYQSSDYYAFEILYKRHSGRLYQYLKGKVEVETAEELLQETFSRIHKSRAKYNTQYPFLPWVFTISRNILFDHFKKAETQTRQNSFTQDLIELTAENGLADFGSIDQLDKAIDVLPDIQKRALKLRYLDDWTFAKIAKEFETTPQNARQLISRGLRKVKSALERKEIDQ